MTAVSPDLSYPVCKESMLSGRWRQSQVCADRANYISVYALSVYVFRMTITNPENI